MRKKVKVLGVVVLCAVLLAGCSTSTSSNSESPSSSTIVQDVASSDSSERKVEITFNCAVLHHNRSHDWTQWQHMDG